jgi:hypothetical protein
MKTPLLQFILVLSLAFMAADAAAQAQTRAYAPENLRSLSVNDQTRVISLEYSEQSNGRRIPDDQLRFYLDQINRSNWNFSRIKQDIASSLGGSQGGWNPGPAPGPGPAGSVLCQSDNNRYQECRTGFRGPAVLSQTISQTRCVEGENWGSRSGSVWVDRGCKGRFVEGAAAGQTVRCESDNGRYRECRTGLNGNLQLARQLSSTRCIEGSTWGQNPGVVWVNGGCRGEFTQSGGGGSVNPGGGDYSVTCSSQNGRRQTCAWNDRYGRPSLIQQLSSDSCREGSSWGYSNNQVWVDRGCRGRFGVRR